MDGMSDSSSQAMTSAQKVLFVFIIWIHPTVPFVSFRKQDINMMLFLQKIGKEYLNCFTNKQK